MKIYKCKSWELEYEYKDTYHYIYFDSFDYNTKIEMLSFTLNGQLVYTAQDDEFIAEFFEAWKEYKGETKNGTD